MLRSLKIENLAILPSLELSFHSGLNVLTGETGAGKSILVEAIGLLAGKRASSHDVRKGEDLAMVEGGLEFEASSAVFSWLKDQGIPCESESVIIRRSVSADGRSRVWVNGWQWNVGGLALFARHWVDVSGQHVQQALLDESTHLNIVDAYGGLTSLRTDVAGEFHKLQSLDRELNQLRSDREEFEKQKDFLLFQAKELTAAKLRSGEEEELQNQHRKLAHASKLAQAAQEVLTRVGEDQGLLDQVGKTSSTLKTMVPADPELAEWENELEQISSRLQDLLGVMRGYSESLEAGPEDIEKIDQRLAQLQQLARKYGSIENAMVEHERIQKVLSSLEDFSFNEEKLLESHKKQGQVLLSSAKNLSKAREKKAKAFGKHITDELKHLGMAQAVVSVEFASVEGDPGGLKVGDQWISAQGSEKAQFRFAPNPGEGVRPLSKIASGGELSRVLLAIKSLSVQDEGGRDITFLFDEVDTGIGGDTAERIGLRLQSLATGRQVLCVTHLAQIACHASSHLLVRKEVAKGRTAAFILELSEREQKQELARMIGGIEVTEKTLAHAEELLQRGRLHDKGGEEKALTP